MTVKDKNQNDIMSQELINSFEIDYIFENKPINRFKNKPTIENINSRLNNLKEKIENIDNCELKKSAKQIVFSDGSFESSIMIVGEGPGQKEDELGKPFVGDAGQLLNKMLEAINILVTYSSKKSTDSLVVSLKNTESKVMQIREAIVNAIGENGSEDEVVTLLELYEVSKANHARMNKLLTLSLGGLGDNRVIPILMDIAKNKEMDIHIHGQQFTILMTRNLWKIVVSL